MIQKTQILNYRIVGEGYPVVFLHGFLESNAMWENILPELNNIQAICIELPGHGQSPLLDKNSSLPLMTEAVINTLQSLSIQQFSIIGHSLGGYVALHLAEHEEVTIEQIVLLHSHPWTDAEAKKGDRNRVAKIVDYNKMLFLKDAIPSLYFKQDRYETQINRLIEEAFEMSKEAIIQTIFAMRDREDKTMVFKSYGEKLTIIQGEFDQLIPVRAMEEISEKFGNKFYLIKNIGHMGHHEAKHDIIQIINDINLQ